MLNGDLFVVSRVITSLVLRVFGGMVPLWVKGPQAPTEVSQGPRARCLYAYRDVSVNNIQYGLRRPPFFNIGRSRCYVGVKVRYLLMSVLVMTLALGRSQVNKAIFVGLDSD